MEYCGPKGIPHSVFLGRVVGPGEPTWLETDRDKAVWWLIHERQTCPNCGTRPDPWEEDFDAYVPVPVHCRGCEVKARADDELEKAPKGAYPRGTTMQLRPRALVEAEEAAAAARAEAEANAESAGGLVGRIPRVEGAPGPAAQGRSGAEAESAQADPEVR